jgi:hypothetical protein
MGSIGTSESPKLQNPAVVLETPAASSARADSFFLESENIGSWIKELPIADIGETGRQVLETLAAFNRAKLPTLFRAEAIELFREPVRYVNSNITMHYADIGFPMGSKATEAYRLTRELCAEIAISYKIIIKEQLATESSNYNQNLVIVAVHRALEYLGKALFQSYLSYSGPTPGVWREIHFLYAWAVQNDVHSIPVKKTHKQSWKQENPCIEDLYKSHILMSTTSPQRLRQSKIHKVHAQLCEWSRLTRLVPMRDVSHNSRAVFNIDLWSDSPPSKLTTEDKTRQKSFYAFDLSNLIVCLRTDLGNCRWGSPMRTEASSILPSRSLLHLLIHGWNISLERRFVRRSLNSSLNLVVGLGRLHYMLEQEKLTQWAGRQQDREKNHTQRSQARSQPE